MKRFYTLALVVGFTLVACGATEARPFACEYGGIATSSGGYGPGAGADTIRDAVDAYLESTGASRADVRVQRQEKPRANVVRFIEGDQVVAEITFGRNHDRWVVSEWFYCYGPDGPTFLTEKLDTTKAFPAGEPEPGDGGEG